MPSRFEVAEVEPGTRRLRSTEVAAAIRGMLGRKKLKFEATSHFEHGVSVSEVHPFVGAIAMAYDHHLPLRLTPDQVWLVIAQGFANHVRRDPESLRSRLVAHSGRVNLVVRRDQFVRGASNDWSGVFGEFSEKLREHLGKRHDLVVADFSTTGALERTVSQLVLMDAMQHFFEFTLVTRCGIPSITLTGTPDDWRSIRVRAQVLREFDLGGWLDRLTPILDRFVDAAEGRTDREFWASFCKYDDASGGPYFTGWLHEFFPYLVDHEGALVVNRYAVGSGPPASEFPSPLSSAPMTWEYLGQKLPMTLLGGFVGVLQEPATLEVTPALGWAVHERQG